MPADKKETTRAVLQHTVFTWSSMQWIQISKCLRYNF